MTPSDATNNTERCGGEVERPSMQDERNRIEARNAELEKTLTFASEVIVERNGDIIELRTTIASLSEENRVLAEALKPFARVYGMTNPMTALSATNFRVAHAALSTRKGG